jgi:hypothetical protein
MDKQRTNRIFEDFRTRFLECWRRLPGPGRFFAKTT